MDKQIQRESAIEMQDAALQDAYKIKRYNAYVDIETLQIGFVEREDGEVVKYADLIDSHLDVLAAAKRLADRGFFAPSSCADAETAKDMAAMLAAITQATAAGASELSKHRVTIWKAVGTDIFEKDVSLAGCPHCDNPELIVSDVEVQGRSPDKFPLAVHCGGCGASGPWGRTEEDAVTFWNRTLGQSTTSDTEWKLVPPPDPNGDPDIPF